VVVGIADDGDDGHTPAGENSGGLETLHGFEAENDRERFPLACVG
jgi:hypothetical protein